MNLQGERLIPATVEKTWMALNDPQTLKACIAGCESIEATGENQYLVLMAVRIGPVNAKFKGRLQLTDIVPMSAYTIQFDGQGGVAGFGKGSAKVDLAPQDDGATTRLGYRADAQVGGKIAQIGSRLVESAAGKIADDFFKAFEARMAEAGAGAQAAADAEAAAGAEAGAGAGSAVGAAPAEPADVGAIRPIDVDAAHPAPAPATAPAAMPAPMPPDAPGRRSTLIWIVTAIAVVLAVYLLVR